MDAPRSATTRRRRMRDVDDSTDDDEDEEDAPAPPSGARTKRHAAHAPAQGSRRLASAPALSDSAGGGDGDRRGATHRHRSSINLGERASVSGSSGNEEEDADAEEFGNGSDTRSQRNDAASDDGQNNDDDDEDDDSTDDNEVAFYNSTIGVAMRTLGWAFSYWLLPLWVVAGSIDSGVLGLLYVSLFVWVTFVPRVERHVADVRRTKDNERFRIPVAFALAPTIACSLLSVLVATAGMVLTGVHGIWWCHREVNLDADWTVGWTKAWSVLGFNPSGSVGACTGEEDLGNHAWVHIVVFIVSVIAVFGMVVQRAKDRHYANHPPAPSQHAANHRHRHGNHHNHQE
ncbi:transmembrane protein, putative, partial [Bodo saltans]